MIKLVLNKCRIKVHWPLILQIIIKSLNQKINVISSIRWFKNNWQLSKLFFFTYSLRFVHHDAGYWCIKFESNLIINHFIRKMILDRIRLNRLLIFIQYFSTAVVNLFLYLSVTIEKITVSHGICFSIIDAISHLFILNLN